MKVVPASVGAARALVASAARLTVDYDDKAASTSAPCSLGPTTHLVQMTDTHAAAVVFGVLMTKYTGELDVVLALPQAKTLLSVAKVLAAPSPSFAGAVQRAGGAGIPMTDELDGVDMTGLPHLVVTGAASAPFAGAELSVSQAGAFLPANSQSVLLHLALSQAEVTVTLFYNIEYFDPTTIAAMGVSFGQLLNAAISSGAEPVSSLRATSAEQEQTLLVRYNTTAVQFFNAASTCLHHLFEQSAERLPDADAIIDPASNSVLSYSELDQWATRVAARVQQIGIQPGSLCAVLLERSPEMYVSILAIMKAGCAYIAIDPAYPAARVAYIVDDSRAAVIITSTPLASKLLTNLASPARLLVDAPGGIGRKEMAASTLQRTKYDDAQGACYVIYTSGSTGNPKGVTVEHNQAVNFVRAEAEVFTTLTCKDRVLQGFSASFDASVEEMWLAWHSGAGLVIGTKAIMQSGPDLPAMLTSLRVTVSGQLLPPPMPCTR